ncbi:ArnT family glycosyltransferase [Thiospirillum jenense]|nr:glycosyltransferase family 39 protein [Thiospirillum jenense]
MTRIFTSTWALLFIVWLAFFWQLGTPPLYDLDEGAFTEATREMLASGNFITPHCDGEPRYDKPVLIYWLQAAAVISLGLNEFAFRLPSAIAATLWVLAVWLFVRQQFNQATAAAAGFALVLSLEIGLIGKAAVADALLNLWLVLTFFDCYRYYCATTETRRQALLIRIYIWLGLGFLTKGPVAIILPLLTTLLFSLSNNTLRLWFNAIVAPRAWLVFLLITLPWYLAIYFDDGAGFFRSFFLHHNLERFEGVIHGHQGFVGYYLVMLPLITLPFAGVIFRMFTEWRQLWADSFNRFMILWFLTVFILFSFANTKLPHYLVYGMTPLCILIARYRELPINRWLAFMPALILFSIFFVLPFLMYPLAALTTAHLYTHAVLVEGQSVFNWQYHLGTFAALVAVIALFFAIQFSVWQRLLLIGVIQLGVVSGLVLPAVLSTLQAPIKDAALFARQLNAPVVSYRISQPSFSVYRQAITPDRPPQRGDIVLTRIDRAARLRARYSAEQLEVLYQRGAILLLKIK